MANQRVVRKSLAGQDDLLFGEGQEVQTRAGGTYNIEKNRLIYPVNSLDELNGLDGEKFPKAQLYTDDLVTSYLYNPSTELYEQTNVLVDDAQVIANTAIIHVFDTVAAFKASLIELPVGKVIQITQNSTGKGGAAIWDVVLTSSVTPNNEDIVTSTTFPLQSIAQRKISAGIDILIPSEFTTIQGAIDFYQASTEYAEGFIDIIIETGHLLTKGVDCRHGDFSKFRLKSQAATVKLAPTFVGVDTSGVPSGVLGETPRPPLLFGFNCVMPQILCVFDMENGSTVTTAGGVGTGYQLAEASGFVDEGRGVINAGFRGAQIHGRANLYLANFTGATGTGLRLQQAASVNARSAIFDDCCKAEDQASSAVYASRSSILEFRGGSAQRSGGSGLIARRSIVTCDESNFDDAANQGVVAESCAQVSWANGSALNCVSNAAKSIANASLYAVGVSMSTVTSADNLNVDVGGVITIAGSTTIEGVSATEAAISGYSNVFYTNAFDEAGMIFFDSGNGTFKITSNANGVSQRFADGRMIAWSGFKSIDTGTIAPGDFSGELLLPTLPDTFITTEHVQLTVLGRSNIGGGGSRICINNYHRGLPSGSAWKIQNTGVQLDGGTSTTLSVQAVNFYMITFGTWR